VITWIIEIDTGAAGRDLGDQLGRAHEVFLRADASAPTATRLETKAGVGLRCVIALS